MRRLIPGLHTQHHASTTNLDGIFLVRVERASYRWHPQKPFLAVRFSISSQSHMKHFPSRAACTAPNGPFGSSPGFFAISVMTRNY
jgi:hypothetical protein